MGAKAKDTRLDRELTDECLAYLRDMPPQCGIGIKEQMEEKDEQITSLEEEVAILTDTLGSVESAIKASGSEVNCDMIVKNFTRVKCYDYGEVRKRVLCEAIQIRKGSPELTLQEAITQAWKRVRDLCRE